MVRPHPRRKEAWGWIGIEPFKVLFENDFGNLIILDEIGQYWRLCPEELRCDIVAKDQDSWEILKRDHNFIQGWNMTRLVDIAVQEHGPLEHGYKFHLVYPAVLGGAYEIENIKPAPLLEIIRISGSIAQQIKDLPEGAKVELKIVD